MTKETEHTPLSIDCRDKAIEKAELKDGTQLLTLSNLSGKAIAFINMDVSDWEDNLKSIQEAVNHHHELVKALKEAVDREHDLITRQKWQQLLTKINGE